MRAFLAKAALLGLALSLAACSNDLSNLTRDEARSMGGGSADGARDLCDDNGWYGDGAYCDEFCPRTDPDCTASCGADVDCPPLFCPAENCPTTRCVAGMCRVADECTARMRWMQKDAYVSTAGRNRNFWPPHTTMELTVTCGDEVVRVSEMVNYGTSVADVDDSGTPILSEVWSDEVGGSRADLLALADAFEGCECGTTFLSLDALDATLVGEIVGELSAYAETNLTCPDSIGGTAAIVNALATGDVDFVLTNANQCAWTSGAGWEEGLNDAMAVVVAATSETLADYHVCNNAARLQSDLFAQFRDFGSVTACAGNSSVCSGPAWFYDPSR